MQDLINYILKYPEVLKKLKVNEASLLGYDSGITQILINSFEESSIVKNDGKIEQWEKG
ncbi:MULTISPECIES: competence pheromone ComX [Bacillus]|uniref:competence pheromone ComX n=1 Tax=Bacillus TaxID=1386 RepID=UPI00026B9CAE|nr:MULTISPECIES: competence pheromone ComX [Bacillus]AIW31073.1 competence protein [Bacillus subtilis]AMQ75332.1 competence protein [Bacillus amyloliquefaciens UMAF6614]ASP23867.1 competence pheromone ComX [Bacillus velezensis]ATO08565.1 competence pheromone ComX [Bacillus velezensis]AWM49121.1 competence pheromone ComX [Bacillus amyloliquefaciens]